jgi:hypothetical protein
MDYKFAGDFTKAALGPFLNAEKKKVWSDPQATVNQDFDPDGKWYSIVQDSRFPGGRACRMLYGKGRVGMQDQSYQVRLPSPGTVANLEYYWMAEEGFSWCTPNNAKVSGGKLSACIQWGPVGGSVDRGTRCMFWWAGSGSNYGNEKFFPTCQDQASGNQLVQPVKYGPKIVDEQLYKLRIQCMGGPQGWASYWIDDQLIAETGTKNLMHDAKDDVFFDFAFFSGGSGANYAPEHDSFARHGGVRYWSGAAYWVDDEGGNGGESGEGGGGSTPQPPAGLHTVDASVIIDGEIYSGRLTKT